MQSLQANGFIVDYIAIADAVTLEPADQSSLMLIGMIAATINSVRLIDNMQLN
jgi:pantothenate synthetase